MGVVPFQGLAAPRREGAAARSNSPAGGSETRHSRPPKKSIPRTLDNFAPFRYHNDRHTVCH